MYERGEHAEGLRDIRDCCAGIYSTNDASGTVGDRHRTGGKRVASVHVLICADEAKHGNGNGHVGATKLIKFSLQTSKDGV